MSAGGAIVAVLTAVPLTFRATKRLHERWSARWRLRHHGVLDGDAREGDLVYVAGVVRPLDETLIAPLSGRPCVAYRSRVTASARSHVGKTGETMQLRPFAVEDADGERIVVDGDRAIFGLPAQKLVPSYERQASFLARHALAKGRARFSEVLIELGANVLVGGTLVFVPREEPPTGELGFRDPPPPDPQLVGNRESPLVIVSQER